MTKSYYMDLVLDTGFSHDGFEVIQQARSCVERGKADEVAHVIALTDKELARVLNLSERTLHRLRPDVLLHRYHRKGRVDTVAEESCGNWDSLHIVEP